MTFKTGDRRHGTAYNKEDGAGLYVEEGFKYMIF